MPKSNVPLWGKIWYTKFRVNLNTRTDTMSVTVNNRKKKGKYDRYRI